MATVKCMRLCLFGRLLSHTRRDRWCVVGICCETIMAVDLDKPREIIDHNMCQFSYHHTSDTVEQRS